jgi:HEAT repeat protein
MSARNEADRSARLVAQRPRFAAALPKVQCRRFAAALRCMLAAAALCVWTPPLRAGAAPLPTSSGAAPALRGGASVARLSEDLASGDAAKTEAAIDALGQRGGRDAVAALAAFIRAGQVDALTDRAIGALGAARAPEALDVLAAMTRHRRAAARVAAYASIAHIEDERASALLANGLRDSDAGVRGVCARSLGERRARSQLEPLFRAFERGVPEAAVALGRIAAASELARFHARLGQAPIQNMLGGYEQLLLRADIDEATKLDVIGRLGEVASLSVKRFLERLTTEHDWSAHPRVQRSLADTARRIDEHPKAQGAAP